MCRLAAVFLTLGLAAIAVRADEPKKDKPGEFTLVNKAKDINVIADRDMPIRDYFRREHIIVGIVLPEGIKKIREAKETVTKFFISYASQNDDPAKASTFGATIDVAPPSEAVNKLLGEHVRDGKKVPELTLIFRPDEKKPGLYHVVGFTERTSVGFFDNDKKNPTDGFSQKDLCFVNRPGFISEDFVTGETAFPCLGTSSVVASGSDLLVAWDGSTRNDPSETNIYLARRSKGTWTDSKVVASWGPRDDEVRHCWQPSLLQLKKGPLMLLYDKRPLKEVAVCRETSQDNGKTWSEEDWLGGDSKEGCVGPVKNRPIELANGDILVPSHTAGGRLTFQRTSDGGKTWSDEVFAGNGKDIAGIQPCVFRTGDAKLQALAQTKQDRICQAFSEDDGKTWSKLTFTSLPSPNSGIDAIALTDGRYLLVYNHATSGYSPLNVAVSADGKEWKAALALEQGEGEFLDPSVIQAADGLVHITYTWNKKKIKHVVLDPKKLELREIKDGKWPE